jgi:hypothetical protein
MVWPKDLARLIYIVTGDLYRGTSILHRVVISQLLLAIAAIQLLRPTAPDPLLLVVLRILEVGLVVSCIFPVTAQLRHRSGSNRMVDFLLYKGPFLADSLTELALTILLFRSGDVSAAENFLVGSTYAKPLAMGALFLILHSICPRNSTNHAGNMNWKSNVRTLLFVGMVVVGSVSWIGGEFALNIKPFLLINSTDRNTSISKGVFLFFSLHVVLTYYFMRGYNPVFETTTIRVDGRTPRQQDYCKATDISNTSNINNINTDNENDNCEDNNEWVILLASLVILRALAAHSLCRLLNHLHALPGISPKDIRMTNFVLFPLLVVVIDHSANAGLVASGDLNGAWTNLIQSTLSTYFFLRPLAALAGHKIVSSGGLLGFGSFLMAIAAWLSIPGIPRRFQAYKEHLV